MGLEQGTLIFWGFCVCFFRTVSGYCSASVCHVGFHRSKQQKRTRTTSSTVLGRFFYFFWFRFCCLSFSLDKEQTAIHWKMGSFHSHGPTPSPPTPFRTYRIKRGIIRGLSGTPLRVLQSRYTIAIINRLVFSCIAGYRAIPPKATAKGYRKIMLEAYCQYRSSSCRLVPIAPKGVSQLYCRKSR